MAYESEGDPILYGQMSNLKSRATNNPLGGTNCDKIINLLITYDNYL